MAQSFFIEKREWTIAELMSALELFFGNYYARLAVKAILKNQTTKNAAGELVYDCGKELDAYSILVNMQAEFLERTFNSFMDEKGHSLYDFWTKDNNKKEWHQILTDIISWIYDQEGGDATDIDRLLSNI